LADHFEKPCSPADRPVLDCLSDSKFMRHIFLPSYWFALIARARAGVIVRKSPRLSKRRDISFLRSRQRASTRLTGHQAHRRFFPEYRTALASFCDGVEILLPSHDIGA
jgi:hypothetical protein